MEPKRQKTAHDCVASTHDCVASAHDDIAEIKRDLARYRDENVQLRGELRKLGNVIRWNAVHRAWNGHSLDMALALNIDATRIFTTPYIDHILDYTPNIDALYCGCNGVVGYTVLELLARKLSSDLLRSCSSHNASTASGALLLYLRVYTDDCVGVFRIMVNAGASTSSAYCTMVLLREHAMATWNRPIAAPPVRVLNEVSLGLIANLSEIIAVLRPPRDIATVDVRACLDRERQSMSTFWVMRSIQTH